MERVTYRGREIDWDGTKQELQEFIEYQRQKAKSFIDEGYSVEWTPDARGFMDVYLPQTDMEKGPEIRANVKFSTTESGMGLDNGRITKLSIQLIRTDVIEMALGNPYRTVINLFGFDTGSSDIDILDEIPEAKKLFDTVVRELN